MSLTEQEVLRYARHIILPEVGGRGQRKLKAASVLLAGLGATGSAAGLYLAAAGIGQLTLVDREPVSLADLAGSIAHTRERVGMDRATSAAVALRQINPDAEVVVQRDLLPASGRAHQVVLASTGDWQAAEGAARHAGASLVLMGISGAAGAAAAFGPGQPCLQCLGPERAAATGLAPERGWAVAAAAGVLGTAAATEVIKLLLGTGVTLSGRVLLYDGWRAVFEERYFERQADCPYCGQ